MSVPIKTLDYYLNLNYNIIIEQIPDTSPQVYTAYISELGKYYMYGNGESEEEAIASLKERKPFLFEHLLEDKDGLVIPEPIPEDKNYSGNFVIRVPKTLHRELAYKAKDEGISLNSLATNLLTASNTKDDLKRAIEEISEDKCKRCLNTLRNMEYQQQAFLNGDYSTKNNIKKPKFPEAS